MRNKDLTLDALFSRQLTDSLASLTVDPKAPVCFTVVVAPRTRAFLDAAAGASNSSAAEVAAMIIDAVAAQTEVARLYVSADQRLAGRAGRVETPEDIVEAASRGAGRAYLASYSNSLRESALQVAMNANNIAAIDALLAVGTLPGTRLACKLLTRSEAVRTSVMASEAALDAWVAAVNAHSSPWEVPPATFIVLFEAGWRCEGFTLEQMARPFLLWPDVAAAVSDLPPATARALADFARSVGASDAADQIDANASRGGTVSRLLARRAGNGG